MTPRAASLRLLRGGKLQGGSPPAVGEDDQPPPSPTDFDALYARYAPYVAAVAVRILGRDDEVDDLVQDTFVNALRGLRGLREPAAVKGWLAKIAVRLALRRLRVRRLRRVLSLEHAGVDYETLATDDASPEQRATIVRVYRALDRLPAAERVAWVLRYVQGEPLHRLPDLLECSLSTAQRRLARAQTALEQELDHD